MTTSGVLLTPEEQEEIEKALPRFREIDAGAARIVARLVREAAGESARVTPHIAIGEAARIYGVTPQTIRNWIDRGWLAGERTPGGTRRIPRAAVAGAVALSRPRPPVPDHSDQDIQAIIEAPRRRR